MEYMKCPDCGITLPHPIRVVKHAWRCRICRKKRLKAWRVKNADTIRQQSKKWALANPEKVIENARRAALRTKYGISLEEFEGRLEMQGGKCLVCSREGVRFCVDHNHKTGKVRGILCHNCNLLIGHSRENTKVLLAAARYLGAEDEDAHFDLLGAMPRMFI